MYASIFIPDASPKPTVRGSTVSTGRVVVSLDRLDLSLPRESAHALALGLLAVLGDNFKAPEGATPADALSLTAEGRDE